MSGHSKWHNIRLRKGKQDAERGKMFTKIAREIIVAAKDGGGNPDTNLSLRMAIQKARDSSMPADNIKRAIQRGTGEIEGAVYDEVSYEGYGAGGVAVLVECLTDNRNRTVADVRSYFAKCGGNLGEGGCVAWMFDPRGVITVPSAGLDEDAVMMAALDAGAEDMNAVDESFEVITRPEDVQNVRQALEAAGIPVASAEATMIPKNTIKLGMKEASQVLRLVEMLEDHDDVQRVHANFDIPDEILEALDI